MKERDTDSLVRDLELRGCDELESRGSVLLFPPQGQWKRVVTTTGKTSGGSINVLRGSYTVRASHLGLFRAVVGSGGADRIFNCL